jgi:ABC-2 type transport system permease protein
MTAPAWLIAEREIRTYVATASFWIALAIGPLIAAGALALSSATAPPPTLVTVVTDNLALAQSAKAAIVEVARMEGRHIAFSAAGARLRLSKKAGGIIATDFASDFPLSREGRALVDRALAWDLLHPTIGASSGVVDETKEPVAKVDISRLSGFILMMMLWLTLTGSLGMLLQSVVRERANRALECLLAAATPRDIMFGKLLGIGLISFAILGVWLGSIAAFASLFSSGGGFVPILLSALSAPAVFIRAVVIYALGYAFYGSLTIALGAIARDSAAAQNLSRPMFVVLLAAFFVALFSVTTGQTGLASWLVYLPPFAPFLLLLQSSDSMPVSAQLLSLALVLVSAIAVSGFAISRLSIAPRNDGFLKMMRAPFYG